MNTIILHSKPRKSGNEVTYTIDVIGDSAIKDAMRESIKALQYHPAKASRRSLIDVLSLIEKHRLEIRHTEHYFEEDTENWLFILQG